MRRTKRRYLRQPKTELEDALQFVSIGLAAAEGRIGMDVFASYLGARRPKKPGRRTRSK